MKATLKPSAHKQQPTAVSRMKQDYLRLKRDPLPYITAEPLPSNILEWHYVVKGPAQTPYEGGYYHGTLMFPREFPFKPPAIYMLTPNGRFKTNTRLCLSISDFHPDTWNPTWCVGTILTGLLSFMLESTPTLGSIESTLYEKQQYAEKSLTFNMKNAQFRELFPEICEEINQRLRSLNQPSNASTDGESDKSAANTPSAEFNKTAEMLILQNKMRMGGLRSYFSWYTLYSNFIILISLAVFIYSVNYILDSINHE